MRTSKFTPEQMVHILRQGESGVPVVEVCRQHGISEQTYYRWKKQFGDISSTELKELRQLRDETKKLKAIVPNATALSNPVTIEVVEARVPVTLPRLTGSDRS